MVSVTGAAATVIVVHEDWHGGAGNGLGTLYAFQKACIKGSAAGVDIKAKLAAGASVAIYHTAGKGTRLAPLPGAENNNKPGVKLPSLLQIKDAFEPITVLEAVMRQTSSYGPVRGGRVSVFWGDQVFVPSAGIKASEHHADILAALRPMPTKSEWESEELHQYGLIAVDSKGDAMQLEKVTYEVATKYLPEDVISVGTSLGSFSMSASLIDALLDEFSSELIAKTASYDSDPHFWMPFTLKREDYIAVMGKKETDAETAGEHYDRMAAFRTKFKPDGGCILGCVDVGRGAYWWDYGRLALYFEYNQHVTEDSPSAHALRTFLRLEPKRCQSNKNGETLETDSHSVVLNCKLGSGRVGPSCVLVGVSAPSIDVEGCVLINVSSNTHIYGRHGLLYNVVHESDEGAATPLTADEDGGYVRADVFMPGKHVQMCSKLSIDGGKVWKVPVQDNEMSFEGVYKANQPLDPSECSALAKAAHARLRK